MKSGYTTLIGRPNVGKSTFLNKILGFKVAIISEKPQTTRTSILGIKTTEKGQIVFVDNPGIHKPLHKLNKRMMNFVYSSLETADVICLLIDATQKFGRGDQFVLKTLKKVSTPAFLLINKVDLIKKAKVLPIIDRYKDLVDFKEIIPISALTGINCYTVEEKIYEYLPEGEKLFPQDNVSPQSIKFILSEIIREKTLHYVEEELPYSLAVHIDKIQEKPEKTTSPEANRPQHIQASIFVEKKNHRKIILGKSGKLIKAIKRQAQKEMELILQSPVQLELQVRVKEKWRDSIEILNLLEEQ
ncbi:GTPase Era [bacterium]|nr:GTPase Era [bacterium]